MTRISVCMATYNGERYIKAQVDSILAALGADDELIISDDLSTDRTLEIIGSYRDPRIVILSGIKFGSAIRNFEHALRHATGQYIFLADQDDVWLPGRVSKVIPLFDSYDLIVCDCRIVDEDLVTLKESYFDLVAVGTGFIRNMTQTSPFIGCCMAFKAEVLRLSLPFPPRIPMHDFWIAMLAEIRFRVLFLREPLVLYRRHGANTSFTGSASRFSFLQKLRFRMNTILSLVPRLLR